MKIITLKPDRDTIIKFLLGLIILIKAISMGSCSVVRTIVSPEAQFPVMVESVQIAHGSTGKKYQVGVVDRRNRIFVEYTNVEPKTYTFYKTYEDLEAELELDNHLTAKK